MVTANRLALCRRAVRCYQQQTYPNKELVVVDDGTTSLEPVLAELPPEEVVYVRLKKQPENVLGHLRNVALDRMRGEYAAQWDDDDWYHPERLSRQMAVLLEGNDACTLSGALMHLDTDAFFCHPYVGYLKDGVPGTIVHRREAALRYPAMRRSEDTVYLQAWRAQRYVRLEEPHLFIRCFHGNNTWEQQHFLTRMRNTFPDLLAYGWYRYVRRNLFAHPRFRLSQPARASFRAYLEDSYELGLLQPHPC